MVLLLLNLGLLVLGCFMETLALMIILVPILIPVLNQPGELARYAALARTHEQRLPAALQIDTGMCRLGFARAEIEAVLPAVA